MEYMILYFVAAYVVILVAVRFIVKYRIPYSKATRAVVLLALLALPLAPYGIVDLQTLIFRHDMLKAALQEHMVVLNGEEVRDVKVLRVWPHRAVVYIVVAEEHASPPAYDGFIVNLVRSGGKMEVFR